MLSEKIVARFMVITLLILTAISSIHSNVNRIMPIDSTAPISIKDGVASIGNNLTSKIDKVEPIIPLKKDIKVLGYSAIDYDGDDRSYESTQEHHESLDAVSTFSYLVDEQGNLVGNAPIDELELHKQKGINSIALIHNFTQDIFDPELAATILGNPEVRKNLIDNIINELSR